MENIQAGQVLTAVLGTLARGNEDISFSGIELDSRKVKPGDLFIPLPGLRADGHDFIAAALKNGACGSLALKTWEVPQDFPEDKVLILVDDVLRALQKLSAFYADLVQPEYRIGVTGSNGKTSTKDLIAAVLSQKFKVCKTLGNHNNEIGVPLTLFSLTSKDRAAVIEMGMRGLGEITELTDLVRPQIGVVTNVGQSHLEILGTQANIAKAKGELIEALPENGCAVLNGDDPYVRAMASRAACPVIFYGLTDADVMAEEIKSRGEKGTEFMLVTPSGKIPVALPLLGLHNVYNALAAAGTAVALQLDLALIKEGLEHPELTAMRLEILNLADDIRVINDAYNASPLSMRSALHILADLKRQNSSPALAVLGNMYELGEDSALMHYEVGRLAAELKIDHLLTVGDLAQDIARGARENGLPPEAITVCGDLKEAKSRLAMLLKPKSLILLKASRSMELERLVAYLRER